MRNIRVCADLTAKAERNVRKNGQTCQQCPKRDKVGWCPILAQRRPPDAKPCAYGRHLIYNRQCELSRRRSNGRA